MSVHRPSSNSSNSSVSDSHDSDHGVGLSDPSLSQSRRLMLDLVNRLHNTGVQIDIDLPQIAVIGSQSAGKSSLIESISGITLPRAAGTCTRCPTECRLSRSDSPWKCTVDLHFITDKNGQSLGQARNEAFGEPIFDKAGVEDRIRRAQRAILNPSKPPRTFLEEDDEDVPEVSFSTNYISLQISGPDVADLSFVDLPGLIASVSRGGNERDIAMVESLVTSYISKPSCVILLTVACETDFENQGAHHLTKKYDPEGKRTIGVLTKPDRIPRGDEESWLPLIRNEQEALENNWYCVKQPSSQDLKQGVTWEEARARENDFFTLTPPWSGLDPMYQKYLRTSNLIGRLSSILSDLISKRLPQIQIELENTIQKTRVGLQQLPKPPSSDPVGEIASLLHQFIGDLDNVLEGVSHSDGLLQAIRPAQERFRRKIRDTAPDFQPFEEGEANSDSEFKTAEPAFLVNEDGPMGFNIPMAEPGSATSLIFIDGVLERAHRARTRELPGHYPFVVQKSFIAEFTVKWQAPAQVLCRVVHSTLAQHVKALITHHFSSFGQGGLEQRVTILVQDYMNQRAEAAQALIAKLIALETDGPLTLNEHYLKDYKAKFLSYYKGAREKRQNPVLAQAIKTFKPGQAPVLDSHNRPVPPTGIAQALSGLAGVGLSAVSAQDLVKLLPLDRMDAALNIMADVRAYFQVAYKRVVDNVPLAIDHELVRGVGRELLPALYRGLGVNGPDGLRISRELAQESPSVAGKREELRKRLERLESASRELMCVGL